MKRRVPQLVSAAVMLVCFFLPVIEFGGISFSPVGMAFGVNIAGYMMSDPSNIIFIVPAICALISLVAFRGKAANIFAIMFGAINIVLIIGLAFYATVSIQSDINLSVGLYLYVLSSIALIVSAIIGLIKPHQTYQAPTMQ
ncbi:hypothetical protein [Coriobacterium glomerans]|nr:hypothetical protein [Coriobacterium glomerans]